MESIDRQGRIVRVPSIGGNGPYQAAVSLREMGLRTGVVIDQASRLSLSRPPWRSGRRNMSRGRRLGCRLKWVFLSTPYHSRCLVRWACQRFRASSRADRLLPSEEVSSQAQSLLWARVARSEGSTSKLPRSR